MEEYLNQIKTISGEVWNFFKGALASWNPEKEEWWEGLISLADKRIMKYKGTKYYQYALKYMGVVMDEIERKYKEERDVRKRISKNGNEDE